MRPENKIVPALPPSPHEDGSCRAVASVLARVGDKWSVLVIMMLINGPMRFNELKRTIGGISGRRPMSSARSEARKDLVVQRAVGADGVPAVDRHAPFPIGEATTGFLNDRH